MTAYRNTCAPAYGTAYSRYPLQHIGSGPSHRLRPNLPRFAGRGTPTMSVRQREPVRSSGHTASPGGATVGAGTTQLTRASDNATTAFLPLRAGAADSGDATAGPADMVSAQQPSPLARRFAQLVDDNAVPVRQAGEPLAGRRKRGVADGALASVLCGACLKARPGRVFGWNPASGGRVDPNGRVPHPARGLSWQLRHRIAGTRPPFLAPHHAHWA